MGSPYQLILLNLIHIQSVLIGALSVLIGLRRKAVWRAGMVEWKSEQERQLKVLLVLFKQLGGEVSLLHSALLWVATVVGNELGFVLAFMPRWVLRYILRRLNKVLTDGLERAGHQIAIADWAEWQLQSSINPPKALHELSKARRDWPTRLEPRETFL